MSGLLVPVVLHITFRLDLRHVTSYRVACLIALILLGPARPEFLLDLQPTKATIFVPIVDQVGWAVAVAAAGRSFAAFSTSNFHATA